MTDIFLKHDMLHLLKDKFVLILGDSNVRSLYKDLLYLYTNNNIAPPSLFRRAPGKDRWATILGDTVLDLSPVASQARDQIEEREFKDDYLHIRFHFITKVYGENVISTLDRIEDGIIPIPDIIIMNSFTWDLTRWGPKMEDTYKRNLIKLFSRIKRTLPDDTLTLYCTTLPTAVEQCKGGIFIKQTISGAQNFARSKLNQFNFTQSEKRYPLNPLEFMKHSLRFMVLEANSFTHKLCMAFGIDLLDLHYHMRFQLHRRTVDGIHWETHAIRFLSCLVLTHISLSLDVPLPGHVKNDYVEDTISKAVEDKGPPPSLSDIGFHKKMLDLVEVELEKKPSKLHRPRSEFSQLDNRKKEDSGVRVVKNARRRYRHAEDEGKSTFKEPNNSNYAKSKEPDEDVRTFHELKRKSLAGQKNTEEAEVADRIDANTNKTIFDKFTFLDREGNLSSLPPHVPTKESSFSPLPIYRDDSRVHVCPAIQTSLLSTVHTRLLPQPVPAPLLPLPVPAPLLPLPVPAPLLPLPVPAPLLPLPVPAPLLPLPVQTPLFPCFDQQFLCTSALSIHPPHSQITGNMPDKKNREKVWSSVNMMPLGQQPKITGNGLERKEREKARFSVNMMPLGKQPPKAGNGLERMEREKARSSVNMMPLGKQPPKTDKVHGRRKGEKVRSNVNMIPLGPQTMRCEEEQLIEQFSCDDQDLKAKKTGNVHGRRKREKVRSNVNMMPLGPQTMRPEEEQLIEQFPCYDQGRKPILAQSIDEATNLSIPPDIANHRELNLEGRMSAISTAASASDRLLGDSEKRNKIELFNKIMKQNSVWSCGSRVGATGMEPVAKILDQYL